MQAQLALIVTAILGSMFTIAIGLECYSCISSADIDCARKPGKQLDVQECQGADTCVTTIMSGVTYRGCLSSVLPNKVCSNLCETCNASLCNAQVYPANRLHCYQCLGSDCINVENSTTYSPIPCPIYKETDRCYTNIVSENTVQRGCEATDLTNDSICRNICLKCNFDGCNNETGLTHHYCLACSYTQSSTSKDYGCLRYQEEFGDQCSITGTNTCYNKVLYGHRGKCFTYINEQTNVVNRGCSSAMGFYPTGNLTECYGENCNSNCLNIKCNVCDVTTNPSCRNQTNILRAETCNAETHSCFSCEEGKNLWRGCGSKLPHPKTNQICYQCRDVDGCNRQSVRSCYKCSSLDEENCATWANISNITASNCTHSEEKCVSTLVSKFNIVYTLRGCESHVIECTEGDPFCYRCDGSLCNYGPKTWDIEPRRAKYFTWLQYRKMLRSGSEHLTFYLRFWLLLIYIWILKVAFM